MKKNDCCETNIFARTEKWEFGETLFTPDMLRVLSSINGEKTLGNIAGELGLSLEETSLAVDQLGEKSLIVMEEGKSSPHTAIFPVTADDSQMVNYPY